MSSDIPTKRARAIAQQLLAYEAETGDACGATQSAAFRVSEKLRRPLVTLAGATAFRALLTRALMLAKAQFSSLGSVQVNPDGSLDGLSELRDDQAPEAVVMLIEQLIGLLIALIGESLLLRLMVDAWPDLQAFDAYSSGESGHDLTR
jgi:hypothetical protein